MKLPPVIDWNASKLTGVGCSSLTRTIRDLKGIFLDWAAYEAMDPSLPVYRVETHAVVPEGESGGLFFGISILRPGKVGDEYFMTKGHFHSRRECGEYYWCVRGQGSLILMEENRSLRTEDLSPGSLHYIPGHTAHRLVNTGVEDLVVGACWPSDAGHDYEAIASDGFSARLICKDGEPFLLQESAV